MILETMQNGEKMDSIPTVVCFDYDGTLASPTTPPSPEMLEKIEKLSHRTRVAVVTSAGFERMQSAFLTQLTANTHKNNIFLVVEMSGAGYAWNGTDWTTFHQKPKDRRDEAVVRDAIAGYFQTLNIAHEPEIIVASGLLRFLPPREPNTTEENWDPEGAKRIAIIEKLKQQPYMNNYLFFVAGRRTIDIVHKSATKAGGVLALAKQIGVSPQSMLFVGDGFGPLGNDTPVIETGIKTRTVQNTRDTEALIDELLALPA